MKKTDVSPISLWPINFKGEVKERLYVITIIFLSIFVIMCVCFRDATFLFGWFDSSFESMVEIGRSFYAGWSASDSQFQSFFFCLSYSVLRFLNLNQKFDICGSLSTIIIPFLICLLRLCLPSYMLSLCWPTPFEVSKPLFLFVFSGKTRTSQAQLAMQVLILTLELVSDVICHFHVAN